MPRIYCKFCKRNHTDKLPVGRTYTCGDCFNKLRRLRYLYYTVGADKMLEDARFNRRVKTRGGKINPLTGDKTHVQYNGWLEEYNQLVEELNKDNILKFERIEMY